MLGVVRRFGPANAVTLVRAVGTAWMLALMLQTRRSESSPVIMITIAVIAGICVLLDGVDGRVARRFGVESTFGAQFDNETDAATTAVLSFALWITEVAGWWVMIIGAMRYLFLIAGLIVPALRGRLPVSLLRKVIGISQPIGMAVAMFGAALVPSVWWQLLPAIALVALCWSFGRDAVLLLAR